MSNKKVRKKTKQDNVEQLDIAYHFPSPIYLVQKSEFLNSVMEVSEEFLTKERKEQDLNDLYPVVMSQNFYDDSRISDFSHFVGSTAWNILNDQGYYMQDKELYFTEMWTQEHHKYSSMEQHTHGYGSQIVGFYFLEVPENSSRVVFHDPRISKTMIDLFQTDQSLATISSQMINFEPKPGLLIFTNSWLAHSFTRHAADKPIKFVHFNLAVRMATNFSDNTLSSAEVI